MAFASIWPVADLLQRAGLPVAGFSRLRGMTCLAGVRGKARALKEVANSAVRGFQDPLGSREVALRTVDAVVSEGLSDLLWFAGCCGHAIDELAPRIVMVGNPFTLEGRVAAMIASAKGIPAVCLEHGTIFPRDPYWFNCPVDRVYVWGEPSKRALLSSGLRPNQVIVAGSSRLDAYGHVGEAERQVVLVATSGPGDQVSHEMHRSFLTMLFRAVDMTPEIPWVVKLHPKDSRELYTCQDSTGPRRNLTVAGQEVGTTGVGIYQHLARSRVLVTVVSTAALDAMACGVPVIAVLPGGSARYQHVDFIHRGAATVVDTAESLAEAVRARFLGKGDPRTDLAAAEVVNEQFANRGHAADLIADDLLVLGATVRDAS